jgi:hypothetical protein
LYTGGTYYDLTTIDGVPGDATPVAINQNGQILINSGFGIGGHVYVLTPALPFATGLMSPASGATGVSTSVSLTWLAATGATSYDVYFGTSSTPPLVTNTTSLSYSPAGLIVSTTYYWQIIARNAAGPSPTPSAIWSFTTSAGLPQVTLSSPPNGATGVSASVSLSWLAATGATSYDVYFGSTSTPPMVTNTPSLSYSPGTLLAGTYYWQINARNASGPSLAPSAVWSFTAGPPPGVTLSSPANGATGVPTSVGLTWLAASGATSYDVYFGTSSTPPLVTNTASLSYSPLGLIASTTYYWQIIARNAAGPSPTPSAIWSFTTTTGLPGPVTLVSPNYGATGVSTTASLTWGAVTGATSYNV